MNEKIERICEVCNYCFKPMTEKQMKHAKYMHETYSLKHQEWTELKKNS